MGRFQSTNEIEFEKVVELALNKSDRGYVEIPELVKVFVEELERISGRSEDKIYDDIIEQTDEDQLQCVIDVREDLQSDIDDKATEIAELEARIKELENA